MTDVFQLADVTVRFGARAILQGITATVQAGQLVAIVGPNGAGKTTLLRTMAGFVRPAAGTVRCFGVDPGAVARKTLARDLAYLPQQYELAFAYSVLDVVMLGLTFRGHGLALPTQADVAEARRALDVVGSEHLAARRFDELSGGEQRLVIIAQALCQGARCLLLDEPTAALDPAHARAVAAAVKQHTAAGGAAVMVTHDLDLAVRWADRLWLLHDGALVGDGGPREILAGAAARAAFAIDLHLGVLPSGKSFAVPA